MHCYYFNIFPVKMEHSWKEVFLMEPLVLTSLQNGILTLTLNNPAHLNALSQTMAAALYDELEKARKNKNACRA